jgi:hypothetical protein
VSFSILQQPFSSLGQSSVENSRFRQVRWLLFALSTHYAVSVNQNHHQILFLQYKLKNISGHGFWPFFMKNERFQAVLEPSRNRVVVPARQATQPGGIGSLESILELLKIRAHRKRLIFEHLFHIHELNNEHLKLKSQISGYFYNRDKC